MGYVNSLEGNPCLPGWGPYVLDGFCVVFSPGFVQLAPRGLVPQAGFESENPEMVMRDGQTGYQLVAKYQGYQWLLEATIIWG